jgi:hypothetical protein
MLSSIVFLNEVLVVPRGLCLSVLLLCCLESRWIENGAGDWRGTFMTLLRSSHIPFAAACLRSNLLTSYKLPLLYNYSLYKVSKI